MDFDAIDQRPRRLQGLRAAIGQERLPQARDLGAIDLSEIAVQSGKLRSSLRRRNLVLSRIDAAPLTRLGCLAFEGQGAFASQR